MKSIFENTIHAHTSGETPKQNEARNTISPYNLRNVDALQYTQLEQSYRNNFSQNRQTSNTQKNIKKSSAQHTYAATTGCSSRPSGISQLERTHQHLPQRRGKTLAVLPLDHLPQYTTYLENRSRCLCYPLLHTYHIPSNDVSVTPRQKIGQLPRIRASW